MSKIKFITLLSFLFVSVFLFSACSNNENKDTNLEETGPEVVEVESGTEDIIIPEMMTSEEKDFFMIDSNLEVQVLARDKDALILSYKFIDSENTLVKNPRDILKSLNPELRSLVYFDPSLEINLDKLISEIEEEELEMDEAEINGDGLDEAEANTMEFEIKE